jgi:hypothetical protein
MNLPVILNSRTLWKTTRLRKCVGGGQLSIHDSPLYLSDPVSIRYSPRQHMNLLDAPLILFPVRNESIALLPVGQVWNQTKLGKV